MCAKLNLIAIGLPPSLPFVVGPKNNKNNLETKQAKHIILFGVIERPDHLAWVSVRRRQRQWKETWFEGGGGVFDGRTAHKLGL